MKPLDVLKQGLTKHKDHRCFKAHYRAQFIHRAIDRYETDITPSLIYEINQLQAMRLADDAWNAVNTTTIRNCWRKASIMPDINPMSSSISPTIPISSLVHGAELDTSDPVIRTEELVVDALNDLEATGVLQHANRMKLLELLNPVEEMCTISEASNEDIVEAVMDAKRAPEANKGGSDEVGGDADENSDCPVAQRLARNEALRMALELRDYLMESNDPFMRKMEVMLGSFGHRTRVQGIQDSKESKITDYFTRN